MEELEAGAASVLLLVGMELALPTGSLFESRLFLASKVIGLNTFSKEGAFIPHIQGHFRKSRAGRSLLRKEWNQTQGP